MLSAKQRELCERLQSDRSRLFRMAYAWSHNTDMADDVVQLTMIKAINNIDRISDIGALDSWLFRILSNCFYDACRKQREYVDIDNVVLRDESTPESVQLQDEMLISVRNAIARLPFKYRQVLTLIDIENFSYAEVAEIIDVPLGTIMSRLNRARQSLKKILDEPTSSDNDADQSTKLKVVR